MVRVKRSEGIAREQKKGEKKKGWVGRKGKVDESPQFTFLAMPQQQVLLMLQLSL